MFKSIANTGIRTRLLGGFALICVLLAATVIYTVAAVSDISSRIKTVVDQRAPVAVASTELVGNLYSTLSMLRGYLLTGDAQGKRDRAAVWADLDRTAAGAAERLAAEVQAFFVKLRSRPMDRRSSDDADYRGPEQRTAA